MCLIHLVPSHSKDVLRLMVEALLDEEEEKAPNAPAPAQDVLLGCSLSTSSDQAGGSGHIRSEVREVIEAQDLREQQEAEIVGAIADALERTSSERPSLQMLSQMYGGDSSDSGSGAYVNAEEAERDRSVTVELPASICVGEMYGLCYQVGTATAPPSSTAGGILHMCQFSPAEVEAGVATVTIRAAALGHMYILWTYGPPKSVTKVWHFPIFNLLGSSQ